MALLLSLFRSHHFAVFSLANDDCEICGLYADYCSCLAGEEEVGELLEGVQVVGLLEAAVCMGRLVLWISKPLSSAIRRPSRLLLYLRLRAGYFIAFSYDDDMIINICRK